MKRRKLSTTLLLWLILLFSPALLARAVERPFFYEALKDGKKIYFLGTIHIGIKATDLPKGVLEQLSRSKVLALEHNIHEYKHEWGMYPDGEAGLKSRLSPAAWGKLVKETEGLILAADLDRVKPFVAFQIRPNKEVNAAADQGSLDQELSAAAQAASIKLEFLEETYDVIKELDRSIPAKQLEEALISETTVTKDEADFGKLMDAYVSGDEELLAIMVMSEISADDQERLLKNRNEAWMKSVLRLHLHGDAFVAIGTAHLVGPYGLLKMMKENGFTVTRWSPTPSGCNESLKP